jgi:hypothetical protein
MSALKGKMIRRTMMIAMGGWTFGNAVVQRLGNTLSGYKKVAGII